MSTYTVHSGDTLSRIAAKYHTSVSALAKTNHLKNVNVISVGQKLTIPGTTSKPKSTSSFKTLKRGMKGSAVKALQDKLVRLKLMTSAQVRTGPGIYGPRTESAVKAFQKAHKLAATGVYNAATAAAMSKALASKPAPKPPSGGSSGTMISGTPLWAQGDSRWGNRILGKHYTIRAAGCAMTATAMAISKISGKPINPGQLDAYLDKHGGYYGDGLVWNTAARARGLSATKVGWSLKTIDANLKLGRPVVIGVNFKPGSGGGANGTDHWITIVGKKVQNGKVLYKVNDPGTGKVTWLKAVGGRLYSASGGGIAPYNSTGELVVFRK